MHLLVRKSIQITQVYQVVGHVGAKDARVSPHRQPEMNQDLANPFHFIFIFIRVFFGGGGRKFVYHLLSSPCKVLYLPTIDTWRSAEATAPGVCPRFNL